ncbi:MAG: glycosyltransferase family 4 protein [Patescibacteria group bacterium]|nr:glycosyltransferase family 4 protein [Patescibacteria group bacterium]
MYLLFTLEYPPFKGGVANYYGNIVKFWPSSDSKSVSDIIVLRNNDNILLKNWLWPKWLPAVWQLLQTIKKKKIKHILVGHILPLGSVAYCAAQFTKTPYSVILHGMDFTYALRTSRKKWLVKKILNKAQNIICANSYVAGLVGNFLSDKNTDKIIIVNPGIKSRVTRNMEHVTQLKKKYNLQNKIVLFSLGRLVKRKGFDKVIKALPKVLKNTPNLAYVIAGTGPDKEYLKKCLNNLRQNAQKKIIFLDKIFEHEKCAWLDLCDIFIMPARNINGDFEGFGIVYLEANLYGKPVIAGHSGGIMDAVQDGVNGLLVNPESVSDIANAIIKLSRDKKLRKKLGERGKERAVCEFNWEKQVRIIYDLIKKSNRPVA